MQHRKPPDMNSRQWASAKKIISFCTTPTGGACRLSISQIATGSRLSLRTVKALLPRLINDRIIGRRIVDLGRPALTWVCDPAMQIMPGESRPRTARVARVEPEIRQVLREDRESLRAVARRFGVCADTIQDIRRAIAPYDPGTAATWRCPKCGALITSPSCLRCSLL